MRTDCREQLRSAIEQAKSNLSAALSQFNALYETFADPCLLYNIARMQHKLGQLPQARESYLLFSARCTLTDSTQRQRAEAYLQQLQQEIANPIPAASGPVSARSASAAAATGSALVLMHPPGEALPLYRRSWFWGVVGGVTAATLGLGIGLGLHAALPSQIPAEAVILTPKF